MGRKRESTSSHAATSARAALSARRARRVSRAPRRDGGGAGCADRAERDPLEACAHRTTPDVASSRAARRRSRLHDDEPLLAVRALDDERLRRRLAASAPAAGDASRRGPRRSRASPRRRERRSRRVASVGLLPLRRRRRLRGLDDRGGRSVRNCEGVRAMPRIAAAPVRTVAARTAASESAWRRLLIIGILLFSTASRSMRAPWKPWASVSQRFGPEAKVRQAAAERFRRACRGFAPSVPKLARRIPRRLRSCAYGEGIDAGGLTVSMPGFLDTGRRPTLGR